jgi:hypothetical protein
MRLTQLAPLLLVLGAAPALAQAVPPGLGGAPEDFYNLGGLGLGVDIHGASLTVRKVLPGSPAGAAGVQEGDEITAVAGQPLVAPPPSSGMGMLGGAPPARGGPVEQVVAEVERCEAQRKRTPVVLKVRHGGAERDVEVEVQRLGPHARTCPARCKKCQAIVQAALQFLARQQQSDGHFPTELGGKTGLVVVTSLSGLAFMAANAGLEPGGPVDRATTYVLAHVGAAESSPFGGMGGGGMGGGANWNQENWELGYGLMFLCEVEKRTRRPDVKEKCAELVARLQRNQEQSGGWAHGPGGPNALGYLELEIVGNYALLGLGAAHRLGLDVDADKVEKALAWIESTSSGDGGVGYSPREGQKGFGEPGRTSGALLAYAALGQTRRPFFERMVSYLEHNLARLPQCHVSPCMHLLAGAMASKLLGGRVWDEYMDTFRLHIMAARRPDGSFASTPTEETQSLHSNTDLEVGPCWTTATYALILSLPDAKLPALLGGRGADEAHGPRRGPRTGS